MQRDEKQQRPEGDAAADDGPVDELPVAALPACWTPRRLRIRSWLETYAPPLAELFQSAVGLLDTSDLSSRGRYVVHSAREILLNLPEYVRPIGAGGRVDYTTAVAEILEQWKLAGLPTEGALPVPIDGATGTPSPTLPIPVPIAEMIKGLLEEHDNGALRFRTRTEALFKALLGEDPKAATLLHPAIAEWIDLYRWFMRRCHAGDRRTDADIFNDELAEKFELLDEFARAAEALAGVAPTYVRAVISGFGDAVAKGRLFDWEPVLRLCRWVTEQPRVADQTEQPLDAEDLGWGWTRKHIARLLAQGFRQGDAQIPHVLNRRVWDILLPLTEDPDPTPELEAKYGQDIKPAELAINSTRTEALHSVIEYALWLRREADKTTGIDGSSRFSVAMADVRNVLDRHLDREIDPSLAIRSVYGNYLPWLDLLDREWTSINVDRIFPTTQEEHDYWDAAWSTYIQFCQPYDSVFPLVSSKYAFAVSQLAPDVAKKDQTRLEHNLGAHIMAFYWRGIVQLDSESLVASFFARAPLEVRAHALDFVGRSLIATQGPLDETIARRLAALWEWRAKSVIRGISADQRSRTELRQFGSWFASGKLDEEWAVQQLRQAVALGKGIADEWRVVTRLQETARHMPFEAIQCLKLIVEADDKDWHFSGWQEDAEKVFEIVLASEDKNAQALALSLINYLGTKGHFYLRRLLQ